MTRVVWMLVFFSWKLVGPVQAQDAAAEPPLWSVSFTMGKAIGGPAEGWEGEMRDQGWGETASSCSIGAPAVCLRKDFPYTHHEGLSYLLVIGRRLLPGVHGELQFSRFSSGTTRGHRDGLGAISVEHSISRYAALVVVRHEVFRLGAGPAVFQILGESKERVPGSESAWTTGLVFDTGLEIPARSEVFLDLRGQYSLVFDEVEIGSFDVSSVGNHEPFMARGIDPSHGLVSVGVGVRF